MLTESGLRREGQRRETEEKMKQKVPLKNSRERPKCKPDTRATDSGVSDL